MSNSNVYKHICALAYLLALLFMSEVQGENSNDKNSYRTEGHPYEGLIIVSNGESLHAIDADGNDIAEIIGSDAVDIDYDCTSGELFWIEDDRMQEISVLRAGDTKPTVILSKLDFWMPISMALDYITNKLYVADAASDTITLYDMYNGKSTVIVGSNIFRIRNIELDMEEGYLFIQDEVQLIRIDLDGANRRIIYNKNNMHEDNLNNNNIPSSSSSSNPKKQMPISKITIDRKMKRVYWVDTESHQVVSINYQGRDKQVNFQYKGKESSDFINNAITIRDNFLYWNMNDGKIIKINLYTGKYSQLYLEIGQALTMKAIRCSEHPQIPNPCKHNNGECQDLCILSKSNPNNFKCACNIGYELNDDNKSCKRIEEYIIFSMESRLRGLSLTNPTRQSDVFDPSVFDLKQSPNLDINIADNMVYYTSLAPNDELHRIELHNGIESILDIEQSMSISTVAYDWAARNLYYVTTIESEATTLCVINVDNPDYIKIVINNLQNNHFTEIIVHPNRGYFYLSENVDDYSIINRANLDGSNLLVIHESMRSRYVQAIALDYERNRLYWSETSYDDDFVLYHSDLVGGDIRQILLPNSHKLQIKSIVIHNEFLYGIVADSAVIRLNKYGNSREIVTLVEALFNPSVSGLKVFSPASQMVIENHPCADLNQCEMFCFAVPDGNDGVRGICGCPEGEVLEVDGRTCIGVDYIDLNTGFDSGSTRAPDFTFDWKELESRRAAPAA